MPRRCSTKGTLCSPVYCVVHPAAGLLHTELTPFILTEQFTFWDQPRYLCWQHHVSGQEPHTRVGKKRVGQEGCARGRDGLRQGCGKGGGGAAHRSRDPAHLCRRAGGARKGVCMRASEVCCRTCTRTPCRSTFRYIGSWAPSPWLLLGVHAERPSKASTFPRHVRRVRTRTEGTNSPKLDHIGLPSVPAASASPARQTSASANAIARRSVARGELRLGPHAARPRSNSLNWAILRVLVFGGNLFFVFLSIHKDLAIVCRSVKPKPAQPEQGRREKVRWSRRNDDHERCAIHGANSSPRQNAAGCAARTAHPAAFCRVCGANSSPQQCCGTVTPCC